MHRKEGVVSKPGRGAGRCAGVRGGVQGADSTRNDASTLQAREHFLVGLAAGCQQPFPDKLALRVPTLVMASESDGPSRRHLAWLAPAWTAQKLDHRALGSQVWMYDL